MAARFKTVLYTLDGTSESLETILNSGSDTFASSIDVRAHRSNAGDVTWADKDASAGGFLDALESADWNLTQKFIKSSDIFFKGTSGDKIYVTVTS